MQNAAVKSTLKRVRDTGESVVTRFTGMPPRRIRRGISPLWFNFKQTGSDQLEFLIELAGLQPTDHVLDIGCGVGRMAIPLTSYLQRDGGYDGFDIAPYMIDWCREKISAHHPNFRFHFVDVASSTSTGTHAMSAAELRFPFDDETFDLAYAGSLFTHLTPEGTENYLAEARRTLRPGGRLVATINMYHQPSLDLVPARSLATAWPNDYGNYRTKERDNPESNVAYEERYVREVCERVGLTLVEPIRPDASYSPARAPKRGSAPHLWYSVAVIAVRS
jgi:ubiquinone/menaquinone biosynthesis C-methylase UbiE